MLAASDLATWEAGYKDAHKAIKAELAARTLELQAAKENEEKALGALY